MWDKIKGAFSFLGVLGPLMAKIPGILDLLGGLLRVGLREEDAQAIRDASAEWAEASRALRLLLDEADQVFLAVEQAVDEASEGGKTITYNEIKAALAETKDIPPAVKTASNQLSDVYLKLKNLA